MVPLQSIAKAAAASTALFKIIDSPPRPSAGIKDPEVDAKSDLHFDNVHFTYPSRPNTEILKGFRLSVPAGKITALVGPSGCGKSTTVGLLERWYQLSDVNEKLPTPSEENSNSKSAKDDSKAKKKGRKDLKAKQPVPEVEPSDAGEEEPILQNSGAIYLGDHNIETLDLKWWRSQIGLVQQEPFLFNDSIYKNIEMGLIGSKWEQESDEVKRSLVEDACKEAFADEFIQRLPDLYETKVGEAGIKLSGGQRQRLAIARSIVKQPAILILDEATSSIDVRAESIVQAALDRVSKNRTTITIAHRLSTIRKAHKIVVVNDGAVVETGTHDSLLANDDSVYAGLVNAQHLEFGDNAEEEDEGALDEQIKHTGIDSTLEKTTILGSLQTNTQGIDDEVARTSPRASQRGFFASVGFLLYEQRQHYWTYIIVLLSAAGGGAAYSVQSYIFSRFIVVFQYSGTRLQHAGNFWGLMFFVLALCVAVCYLVLGYFTNVISVLVSNLYRQRYFEDILGKPIEFYDQEENSSGTLAARLSNDPKQLQEMMGPNLALPLISIFNLLGCIIISFIFGWKLSLAVVLAALPVILGAAFLRIRYEMQFESYNASVFAESSKFAAETISAFRTVTALTLEDAITARFETLLKDQVVKAFRKARYAVLVFALSDSIELACTALVFWYGGQLLASREYNVGQFFVIDVAIVQGGQAAGQFLAFGPNIGNSTAAARRIIGMRSEPEVGNYQIPKTKPASSEKKDTEDGTRAVEVDFRDVSFTYPTRETPVFRHFNLRIEKGEYIAFVGPSGCGKTTVISLLARFYSISSGTMQIDGANVQDIPLGAYRSQLALVGQEPTLFEGSIRENLMFGLSQSTTTDEAHATTPNDATIEEACRAAEIHDFISSLPEGYATQLTSGTHASLSGGQKQRLCIARALLRRPRLLLLDEATSSLDSQSERLVKTAIEGIASRGDVTIVVVAHRLATVQGANRIVVLGQFGQIVEIGRHSELISKRGIYWRMCQAQALDR